MEENPVELFDYFRVIWKRKILIIVVTLVCAVAVVVAIVGSVQEPLVTYRANAVVKIGRKMELAPTTGQPTVAFIDSPGYMVRTIPLDYGHIVKKVPGYRLDIEQVGALAMLELICKGPDRGVERVLKELVDILIDEHRRKADTSMVAYNRFISTLKLDVEMLKKEILAIETSIDEMKRKEGDYLVHIESDTESNTKNKEAVGDRSAFLNMLYLKTVDKERELSKSRTALRKIQQQLSMHLITLGNFEEHKTELVGKVESAALKPDNVKGTKQKVMLAGIASLIMALSIAFIVEYIEESKLRRKGKLQG